ncbi:MAG TPA: hypothetical protein ENK99_03250 [Campylobacterales bacterium]|nr:hypothetical protein [Campylobacterota bacterium]HHD80609.1 hypothetical protein [Campylobacterales bacterium]
MKKMIFKLSAMAIALTSAMFAGGDITPPDEPMVEPIVTASSGDAMGLSSMLILMFLTTIVGLLFVKKESEIK